MFIQFAPAFIYNISQIKKVARFNKGYFKEFWVSDGKKFSVETEEYFVGGKIDTKLEIFKNDFYLQVTEIDNKIQRIFFETEELRDAAYNKFLTLCK